MASSPQIVAHFDPAAGVARMERSEIRGRFFEIAIPDCATLHPGYNRIHDHLGREGERHHNVS